ncbi:hypothetical protein BpHYR1_014717 [Brachionus plicatilis]|uniref:Uncharacterized protein n=1 Tax=Brachionus plicatilis TaxID=10195 RepID=A0A3M7RJ91_BRAPC|nr:hypothetical protein BpHYR1_014717 [Brachionus plicatilis]
MNGAYVTAKGKLFLYHTYESDKIPNSSQKLFTHQKLIIIISKTQQTRVVQKSKVFTSRIHQSESRTNEISALPDSFCCGEMIFLEFEINLIVYFTTYPFFISLKNEKGYEKGDELELLAKGPKALANI